MPQQDFWSAADTTPKPPPAVPPLTPAPQPDFWSAPAKTSEAATAAPAQSAGFWQSPESGQKPSDPNQSFLGKAWDWQATPLINFNPENKGGFTGGALDVASSLTAPGSIALTVGTLGAGPILRGLGLAAEELPVAIKGIKGLVDAGFTVQGAVNVAKESPRVLDALKEGDYETAKRLAVHVAAGGAMTYLGAKHASSDLGDLADTAAENLGFKVKPSQAVKQISGLWGVRNREVQEAQDTALAYAKQAKSDFQKMDKTQREGTMYLMQSPNGAELVNRYNDLAEAAGRSDLKEQVPGVPIVAGTHPQLPDYMSPEGLVQKVFSAGNTVEIPRNQTHLLSEEDWAATKGQDYLNIKINKLDGNSIEYSLVDKNGNPIGKNQYKETLPNSYKSHAINQFLEQNYEYKPMDVSQPTAGKTFFHGTTDLSQTFKTVAGEEPFQDITKAKPSANPENTLLYGPGFYITDRPSIAAAYGQHGGVLKGRLGDLNLVDLEQPTHPKLIQAVRNALTEREFGKKLDEHWFVPSPEEIKQATQELGLQKELDEASSQNQYNNAYWEILTHIYDKDPSKFTPVAMDDYKFVDGKDTGTKTPIAGKDFYDSASRVSSDTESSEVNHKNLIVMQTAISNELSKLGYDGFRHEGGNLVGNKPHNVVILFPGVDGEPLGNKVLFNGKASDEMITAAVNTAKNVAAEILKKQKAGQQITEYEQYQLANALNKAEKLNEAGTTGGYKSLEQIIAEGGKTRTPEQEARYSELKSQQNVKQTHTQEEIAGLLKAYKAAINPTPEMRKLAEQSKNMFEDLFRKAKDGGVMKNAIERYITQIWKKEDLDNPAANRLRDEAAGPGFAQNVSMARKRTFENAFEGQLLGRKLQTADPITLVSKYISDLGEVLANRNFKKNVLENVRASDGRPVAALSGAGRLVTDENGDSAVLVNPSSAHDVRIKDQTIGFLKQAGVFDQWLENGTIVKIPHESKEIYGWNTHDYRESPSSAFEDWHYAGHGTDGTPVLVKARYNIHPEAYDYLNRLVGAEPSKIREMKPLHWLLKASSEAKHMMLSFSPFHLAQEGLRAVMTGISPFHTERLNINENPTLGKIVEEGLTRGKEHLGLADYEDSLREGLGGRSKLLDLAGEAGKKFGILGKPLTVLRDIQNYTTDFLFDKYLPALKDRAALELYDRWNNKLQDDAFFSRLQKDHPEFNGYTKDRAAAKLAAMETNERFGGLNYKQMGRAVGTQDFLRLATLAPDWLESEMRSIKRIFDPTGGTMLRRDVVRLTAGLWATSRALNMLISGKPHNEAPFGVAWTDKDGKEKIYSIRSLPTDMFHASTDPVGFMRGRMSPLVRSTAEAYSGRDFQGRKLTPGDTAVDIVRNNFVPIPAQAVLKGATGGSPDLTTPDQAIKAAGLTAQVYRTEAQKLANQLASNKNETGPVDEAQLRKHRATIDLENQIRSGQAPVGVLNDLVENGHLSIKDAKVIHKNVTETHGMDPEMAQLYSQSARLPAPDFLKIWDAATPAEQATLTKLLIKKRTAYNQKVLKEMTPAQRTADPTYQRFKQMFPGQMVF